MPWALPGRAANRWCGICRIAISVSFLPLRFTVPDRNTGARPKTDEVRQVEAFLRAQGVERLALVVASSIGADLASAFLAQTGLYVEHVFFDGGQFAQIGKGTRRIMMPFLYLAIKSLYWSGGGTLKKILWCEDAAIKPYFIAAGKAVTYGNLRRQLSDSLEEGLFSCFRKNCKDIPILHLEALRSISSIGMP